MPNRSPHLASYPILRLTNRPAQRLTAWALGMAGLLGGCGPINPNFQTILTPDAATYSIEGAVTRGFAARARVGYVQSQGENPDVGSFQRTGPKDAGIVRGGLYIPSATIPIDTEGRFKITFTAKPRFAIIRLFAWDDTNANDLRDINESLSPSEWELKKNDQQGWTYNASGWNQFNFTFNK